MIENLAEPRRAVDLFGFLFTRLITGELLGMATGETMAHLEFGFLGASARQRCLITIVEEVIVEIQPKVQSKVLLRPTAMPRRAEVHGIRAAAMQSKPARAAAPADNQSERL